MVWWLAELLLRLVLVPSVLDVLGDPVFSGFSGLLVVVGTLPWWLPRSRAVAAVGHIARRVQGPPEGSWEAAASATAGWSRITFRCGVIAVAALDHRQQAAVYIVLAMVLLWIIDGASQLARWMHPSRVQQGAAFGVYDPARFFQRAFDAALWLAMWPAILLAAFGAPLVTLWLGRAPAEWMTQLFAAVIPFASIAFVTGQWVHGRGGEGLVHNVVRFEALIVLTLTLATWPYLGVLAPLVALLVAQALMSSTRFVAAGCRAIGVNPVQWLTRRLGIAVLVAAPAVMIAVGGTVIRAPKSTTELLVTALLVTITYLVSTVTWWNLSARRGW